MSQYSSKQSSMTQMTGLHETRLNHVFNVVKDSGAERVLDLGCGSGSLLYRLAADSQFAEIVGLEDSGESLKQARDVLAPYLDASPLAKQPARVRLLRGSYADKHRELMGFPMAVMVETIEHVQPATLSRVEQAVFGYLRPTQLYLTTPNREYNPLFDLAPGEFREADHKFEWDRGKFRQWCSGVAKRNGYRVRLGGIGDSHPEFGQPTQTALFVLNSS